MRHLNLLPPERKAGLQKELLLVAAMRLFRSAFWAIVFITAVGLGAVTLMWIINWQMEETVDTLLIKRVHDYNDWRVAVSRQNDLLHAMDSQGKNRVVWSQIISSFLATVPPGTSVQKLSAEVKAGESILTVTGQSLTRNTIVLFEERLRKLAWVKQVEAPRKNLLKRVNADYEFKIYLKEEAAYGN